jgi:branched-chain amino acid aminotransferase
MAGRITETDWIWRDGEVIPWAEATVHVMSHVVHYGSSVFEGIRCYPTAEGPSIFRLHDHIKRFYGSCRVYRMAPTPSAQALADACAELVHRNRLDACYIRPIAFRGLGAVGLDPAASPVRTYVICWPWGEYLGTGALERGVNACVSSWRRPAADTLPALVKAGGNYLSGQLIATEARLNGYDEGIALSPDGLVSEASGQNLFLVRDGTLITPAVDGSLLPGITRDCVLTLARDLNLPARQEAVPRELLYLADEAFLVGTASEVTPIRSIDRVPIADGAVGPVTRALQQRLLDIAHGRLPDAHGWRTSVASAEQGVASLNDTGVAAAGEAPGAARASHG